MRRTQLYLEQDLWKALHVQSKQSGVSVSELVRQTLREHFVKSAERRKAAMQALVGIWKDRTDLPSTETYVRSLRKGRRLDQFKA